MSTLTIALNLLKYATILVPALGDFISAAVAAFTPKDDEQRTIADQVKAVLPEKSASSEALNDLLTSGVGVSQ